MGLEKENKPMSDTQVCIQRPLPPCSPSIDFTAGNTHDSPAIWPFLLGQQANLTNREEPGRNRSGLTTREGMHIGNAPC